MRKSCLSLLVVLFTIALGCSDNAVTISRVQDAGPDGVDGDADTEDASEESGGDVASISKDVGGSSVLDDGASPSEVDGSLRASGDCDVDVPCDDGNPCTMDDGCTEGGICAGSPVDCDDGLACTVDTCAEDGSCRHGVESGFCLTSL